MPYHWPRVVITAIRTRLMRQSLLTHMQQLKDNTYDAIRKISNVS